VFRGIRDIQVYRERKVMMVRLGKLETRVFKDFRDLFLRGLRGRKVFRDCRAAFRGSKAIRAVSETPGRQGLKAARVRLEFRGHRDFRVLSV
jgi:hypothetical protein